MRDKLILRKEPSSPTTGGVRIGGQEYLQLKELSERTGISVNRLATRCIRFALDRVEVEEDCRDS